MLFNDGSQDPPKLRVYLNMDNLADLPAWSRGPRAGDSDRLEKLAADGFEGVQWTLDGPVTPGRLPHCGIGRIDTPEEAFSLVAKRRDRGDVCLTVHAGVGIEDDDEAFRLVEALLEASQRYRLPVFLETHRATITQDMWRTVQLAKRFPGLRFNGDFSHYYCGQEMVYGGLERKLAFLAPVFAKIGFLHGRIASPGCMQAAIGSDLSARPPGAHGVVDYLADFREIWTRALRGFLDQAGPGDVLIFAPELLSGTHYYARLFPGPDGTLREESDRYAEALAYARLIRELFEGLRGNPAS